MRIPAASSWYLKSLPMECSYNVGVSAQEYLDYPLTKPCLSETAVSETPDFNSPVRAAAAYQRRAYLLVSSSAAQGYA